METDVGLLLTLTFSHGRVSVDREGKSERERMIGNCPKEEEDRVLL